MGSKFKNFVALLFGIAAGLILMEVFLQIYHPFPLTVKGDQIRLPANHQYVYENDIIEKLDSKIVHSKNSLGFRGAEPPKDFEEQFTLITVGGSTTECMFISDGKAWPALLGHSLNEIPGEVWLNNGGLDGHTTFGHKVLMEDYLIDLRPDMVLFLVGINDMAESGPVIFDSLKTNNFYYTWRNYIASKSEVVALVLNMYRTRIAKSRGLIHYADLDIRSLDTLIISQVDADREFKRQTEGYLSDYEQRISDLIKMAKENNIEPVFITQPALYGKGFDEVTSVNLAKIRITATTNGLLAWRILESYNDVLRKAGRTYGVLIVDLANDLSKNSSYFYDFTHFTNMGCKEVASIISSELRVHLEKNKR